MKSVYFPQNYFFITFKSAFPYKYEKGYMNMKKILSFIILTAVLSFIIAVSASAAETFEIHAAEGENGKYAFFSDSSEQLTDYVYDEIIQDFTTAEPQTNFWSANGESAFWHYTEYTVHTYAIVMQDGIQKYINADFEETEPSSFVVNYTDNKNPIQNIGNYTVFNWSEKQYGTYISAIYDRTYRRYIWLPGDYGVGDYGVYNNNVSVYENSDYIIIEPSMRYALIDRYGRLIIPPNTTKLGFYYGLVCEGAYTRPIDPDTLKAEPKPVYNTNIRAKINNTEIPCYAVDGYAVIAAEDLGSYGFDIV